MSATLSAEQQAVVEARPDAQLMVIAGAGTGKTHVLIRRLAHLIEEHDAGAGRGVLVLSFTRAAVREIRDRTRLAGGDVAYVRARTFDSFATRLLMEVDPDGAWVETGFDDRIVAATEALREGGEAAELIADYEHVFIDEIQDLVDIRAAFVQAIISAATCGFSVFGDPAQGIYEWQVDDEGAGRRRSLSHWIRTQFPNLQEVSFTTNHRAETESARQALWAGPLLNGPDPAYSTIQRDLKNCLLDNVELPSVKALRLAAKRSDGRTAVLCRYNRTALAISRELHDESVYHRLQRRATDRAIAPWVARVLAPLGPGPVGRGDFERSWQEIGLDENGAGEAWAVLCRIDRRPGNSVEVRRIADRVRVGGIPDELTTEPAADLVVSTIHRAKGLEFDRVVIVDWDCREDERNRAYEEDTRVLYVALTRAKREVFRMREPEIFGYLKDSGNGETRTVHRGWKKWQRFGMEVRANDIDAARPPESRLGSVTPTEIQQYLAEEVGDGDPVRLELDESHPPDGPNGPSYVVMHGDLDIGRTTGQFARTLLGELKLWPRYEVRTWPETIDRVYIDAVDSVTGTGAATAQAGLGDTGLFLRPRLVGLGDFGWPRRTEDDPSPPPEVSLPAEVVDYLDRLVFLPKREYAEQYARSRLSSEPPPPEPQAEWGAKVRHKIDRLLPR